MNLKPTAVEEAREGVSQRQAFGLSKLLSPCQGKASHK